MIIKIRNFFQYILYINKTVLNVYVKRFIRSMSVVTKKTNLIRTQIRISKILPKRDQENN